MVSDTPMGARELCLTAAELTEIGELFRKKLARLRTEERRSRGRATDFTASRRRHRLGAIESETDDDAILSSAELGQLLGVHPKTVTRWATESGLPCVSHGRRTPALSLG